MHSRYLFVAITTGCAIGISSLSSAQRKNSTIDPLALKPTIISQRVRYDTDDPAIWINKADASQSLILGTDKATRGALYVFNLKGKIVGKVPGLKRPNNVDIAYGIPLNGKHADIAVVTERETGKIRIYTVPDLKSVDHRGIEVYAGETENFPMGLSVYTNPADNSIYAIVGRKNGPSDRYLWQYHLTDDGTGNIQATVVRKFGQYSGKKEIESIAIDNELGYVYYSDEQFGIHKYYAHPDSGDHELALFGQADFKEDIEGISIYKHKDGTGYIIVSDQQANSFMIYPREGAQNDPQDHRLITGIPLSTIESDGSEVTHIALGDQFPLGMFVAMTNGRRFQFYDWRAFQEWIDRSKKPGDVSVKKGAF